MTVARAPGWAALCLVAGLVVILAGCSTTISRAGTSPSTPPPSTVAAPTASGSPAPSSPPGGDLSTYTDAGDGCQQVVSTIGYADESLVPLGNEEYQDFDEVALSRLASVSGAIALEVRDFPNAAVLAQARRVGPLADAASAPQASAGRIRALREFRREAAELVILCADALATSSPAPSPSS